MSDLIVATQTTGVVPKLALVVDGDPAVCEILRQALGQAGILELPLTGSLEAAKQLETRKFDLVFVDARTSPLNGVELTRSIRQSGPNSTTPIILIGSHQSKGALAHGFHAGASFFVSLPMDTDRLTKLVVNILAMEQKVRRFRRVVERIRVQLASAHLHLEGETIDLSPGGMRVRVPRTFPRGALVELSLYLPTGAKPVVGLGSVTRTTASHEMGVRIDQLTIEESRRLQEYLLRLFVPSGIA